MNDAFLKIDGVSRKFGSTEVLRNVSLSVRKGEIFFLLGPSGCGKTTLLRIVAGFCAPDEGSVCLDGRDITAAPPHLRDIGMVFQNYALWPHMTVRQNVAYGLSVRRLPPKIIRDRTDRMLGVTQLDGCGDRFPSQLSGGQQQRVALCRALVVEPKLLLLDEPLSNLDAKLREQLRDEIRRIQRETGITMVYVTHDQREALTLGHRIAVVRAGRIVQTGAPMDLYFSPRTAFAAGFVGTINTIEGRIVSVLGETASVQTPAGTLVVRTGDVRPPDTTVTVGFRPEVAVPDGEPPNAFAGKVADVEYAGETIRVVLDGPAGLRFTVHVLASRRRRFQQGESVRFSVRPDDLLILEREEENP